MTAETALLPAHALSGRDLAAETGGIAAVEDFHAAVSVRVAAAGSGAAAAADALGVALPVHGTWAATGRGRVVWLGPDEWLVTEPAGDPPAGPRLESSLRRALTPHGGTAVDVSAQRLTLRLSGPHARAVLAKGCSIDVHPRSFGPHAAAQTTLGQAGIVLLSSGSTGEEFAVIVRSSFAGYLADWLADATGEFRS